jgi:hypothetical protein
MLILYYWPIGYNICKKHLAHGGSTLSERLTFLASEGIEYLCLDPGNALHI